MNKPLVIYHFPCDDGYASALAAWIKFGTGAEYCGRDHNDPIDTLPSVAGRTVYILDFSFKREVMDRIAIEADKLVWLDHHKTSFELCSVDISWAPSKVTMTDLRSNVNILLDNSKSGCVLSWEHFFPGEPVPLMFKFIDDVDRWVHKMPDSTAFSNFLCSNEYDFETWHRILLLETHTEELERAIQIGAVLEKNFKKMSNDICERGKQPVLVASERGLACNASHAFSSDIGAELAKESGTFGMTWFLRADGTVSCSLRSRGDFDVSAMAKSLGGGGHKNASGFATDIDTLKTMLYFN